MRPLRLKLLSFVLLTILGLSACVREIEELDTSTWNPDIAVPLVNTTISLQDVLDNFETGGFVDIDDDNLLKVVYEGEFEVDGISLVSIPTIPFILTTNNQTFDQPKFGDKRFDIISMKQGVVTFSYANSFPEDINVDVTFTDVVDDSGNPLNWQFTIPQDADPTNPTAFSDSLDVTGYDITYPNAEFNINYTATGATTATPYTFPFFTYQFRGIKYDYIEGYFGNIDIPVPGNELVLDLLKNWDQGNVFFVGPKVLIELNNTYGLPMALIADSLSFTTHTGGVMTLNNTQIDTGFHMAYPTLAQIGQPQFSSLELNDQNSDMSNIIQAIPYELFYNFGVQMNPNEDTTEINFITDDAALDVGVDVEIPIHATAQGFTSENIINFSFDGINEGVERSSFKLITENGFPFDIGMQVFFLNSANDVIDSLFVGEEPILFAGAPVDSDGRVTQRQNSEKEVILDETRFADVRDLTSKIKIAATFETIDGGTTPVKVFSDYDVNVRLGMSVGL